MLHDSLEWRLGKFSLQLDDLEMGARSIFFLIEMEAQRDEVPCPKSHSWDGGRGRIITQTAEIF